MRFVHTDRTNLRGSYIGLRAGGEVEVTVQNIASQVFQRVAVDKVLTVNPQRFCGY